MNNVAQRGTVAELTHHLGALRAFLVLGFISSLHRFASAFGYTSTADVGFPSSTLR